MHLHSSALIAIVYILLKSRKKKRMLAAKRAHQNGGPPSKRMRKDFDETDSESEYESDTDQESEDGSQSDSNSMSYLDDLVSLMSSDESEMSDFEEDDEQDADDGQQEQRIAFEEAEVVAQGIKKEPLEINDVSDPIMIKAEIDDGMMVINSVRSLGGSTASLDVTTQELPVIKMEKL